MNNMYLFSLFSYFSKEPQVSLHTCNNILTRVTLRSRGRTLGPLGPGGPIGPIFPFSPCNKAATSDTSTLHDRYGTNGASRGAGGAFSSRWTLWGGLLILINHLSARQPHLLRPLVPLVYLACLDHPVRETGNAAYNSDRYN